MTETHDSNIQDQFTRQATRFGAVPAHSDESSLRLLADVCGVNELDVVLDVACGPGIVSCYLAKAARHVTGTDVVPAMLQQAAVRQAAAGAPNIGWQLADAEALPFESETFSLVVTRYSFHHLLRPATVFAEMCRVCQSGGRIVVCDVTPEAGKADAYDSIEKLRDPSHVHAMPLEELKALSSGTEAELIRCESFVLPISLADQLRASFPVPGGARCIEERIARDIGNNGLSVGAEYRNGEIWYNLPISILVWRKPGILASE